MKWFSSDWHLGEDRLGIDGKPNLFFRPFSKITFGKDLEDVIQFQNEYIWSNFCAEFKDGDELWHLGDVMYSERGRSIEYLRNLRDKYPRSKFNLVVGNYDQDKLDLLEVYFDTIWKDGGYIHLQDGRYDDPHLKVGLNHYPATCKKWMEEEIVTLGNKPTSFCLTGHIHSLWKVQTKMINVGVDAWNYRPVSEDEILFCFGAMNKHYDENVFPYTWNK